MHPAISEVTLIVGTLTNITQAVRLEQDEQDEQDEQLQ
jgi:hypothetical protein